MLNKLLLLVIVTTVSSAAANAWDEVKTPADMAACIRTYVLDWLVFPDHAKWENQPTYEFAGKYFSASWSEVASANYGMVYLSAGPKSTPVYCDLETNPDASPDLSKPGFCKSTASEGSIELAYTYFDSSGRKIERTEAIGLVLESKVYCKNLPRP